jgi:hypothetical protein
VIEVHVGGDDVADLAVVDVQVVQGAAQVRPAVGGAGFDDSVGVTVADQVEAGDARRDVGGVDAGDVALENAVGACVWRVADECLSPVGGRGSCKG